MSTVTTKDGVAIFYKDWGPKNAQPIVFHHGWPLSADDWDTQMLYFLGKGYRVVAHDRRGHGRSSQVSDGHDMDHYAADVAAVANCALIALVWVACLFSSVTRDYTAVTVYFAVGLLLAVVAVTKGYNLRPELAIMLWGFNIGLGATLFGLLARIIGTFPFAVAIKSGTTPQ